MSSTRRTSRHGADERYCLLLKLLNFRPAVGLEDRHCGNLVGTIALLFEGIRDERVCTADILRKSANVEADIFSCLWHQACWLWYMRPVGDGPPRDQEP